jgi:hypothetical protein
MTYGGVNPVHCHATIAASLSHTAAAQKNVSVKIAKNDVVIDDTEVICRSPGSDEPIPFFVQAALQLSPTDFVSLFVANLDDTTSLTVDRMNFHIIGGTI